MTLWLDILTLLYSLSAIALAVYSIGTLFLLFIWWRHRRRTLPLPDAPDSGWPTVLVQLPVYNERAVILRLIDAVAALDYPRERLRIQVLDDSTDDTSDLIAARVKLHAGDGLNIAHVRRDQRIGYKAGALSYGLEQDDADLVAIFDADFVPPPDFLRSVIPHFHADPRLGMVQTRWGHLNASENLLTRAQALSLDGHFIVEQTARSRGGLLLNFSGSAGVWRTACIRDAGGWSAETLAEDLDLSYRAQLRGWRFLYLPEVEVRAEIPPQFAAYRQQQARWAKGNTQNIIRHSLALWRSRAVTPLQKLMGTLHLCQYIVQPLLLLLLLLTPPLASAGVLQKLPLTPLGLAGLGPPLVYLFSQWSLYPDWPRRLLAFPVLVGVGTGLILNNTLAVIAALRKTPNEFRRTPKFQSQGWQRSRYALSASRVVLGELLLTAYALWGAVMAAPVAPSLVPFLYIYVYAFGMVVLWSVGEVLLLYLDRSGRSAQHGRLPT